MNTSLRLLVVAGAACMVAGAFAHGDTIHFFTDNQVNKVGLKMDDGTIHEHRAFEAELLWNTSLGAYTTSSPGWTWDTLFTPDDSIHFDLLLGLHEWNGTKFVSSTATMKISLTGSAVNTGSGFVEGFSKLIEDNDHFHYRYTLNGFTQDDPDSIGIYRLAFLTSRESGGNRVGSYPGFSLVLNRGGEEADFLNAVDYAENNPVPEPATIAALGLGVAALCRFRRR